MRKLMTMFTVKKWVLLGLVILPAVMLFLTGWKKPSLGDIGKVVNQAKTVKKLIKSFEDISPEQEYYIGRAVGATVAGQYKVYKNKKATMYVNTLGQTLAQASDRPETFGGYHFLILDSDEINAFAAPGGLVFITRGMLRCTENEDALAAVLAHEIGHVQHQHGLQSIKKSRFSSMAADVALDAVQSRTGGAASVLTGVFQDSIHDVTTTMITNGYSRKFEKEADNAAVAILKRVGYDPNGLIDMLNVMKERLNPKGNDFAKTHPSPSDRIKDVKKKIGKYVEVEKSAARQARFETALKDI
ncbi:peptidase M48 [candidate division KSB3 bacterium]|uniref:Peptidase M48 n=1 Tax=candidate division KSB3 bacterium TaxID=2044937 RepID=A0A2G6KJQ4_9BACT|nr:MAG: peptidase M48 [candidate division KSB3 bacterium]